MEHRQRVSLQPDSAQRDSNTRMIVGLFDDRVDRDVVWTRRQSACSSTTLAERTLESVSALRLLVRTRTPNAKPVFAARRGRPYEFLMMSICRYRLHAEIGLCRGSRSGPN